MIPADYIAEWRQHVPWVPSSQVEQDLVLSRVLVETFGDADLARSLAFRGGTALFKLHLTPAPRYSEDIDLVQTRAEPIGATLDRLRSRLDPWLGEPRRSFGEGRVTLVYRFASEDAEPLPLRLKLEINSREHLCVLGIENRPFEVRSRWFTGAVSISSYTLDELLGTKLRALYQRRKGRDLFDLWWAATHAAVDFDRVVACFREYLKADGLRVSRAEFEANLHGKLQDRVFQADLGPVLARGVAWDLGQAASFVLDEIAPRLSGEAWKGP
ncbi:MAG: nucleotidyl transferase AbiEii/AbiGii toxin family protein [Thermoanaerobaculia bacterium]